MASQAVFLYSQVTWDEVWQRPQQYAWLASKEATVIYCCPVQLHNLLFLGKKWREVRRFQGEHNLLVLSPLVFSGHFKSRWIHELNCWITAAHTKLAIGSVMGTVSGVVSEQSDHRPSLRILANTPFALRVIERLTGNANAPMHRERLVFDIIDDFTAFDWSPDFGIEFDARLSAMSDVIIAGTHELAAARPGTEFIPCGVDFQLFAAPQPEPPELQSLARPIIGYFGTISERIDLNLIDRLAREFPAASVVMVGPIHFDADALPRRKNLHYLGLHRHEIIPAFAQRFDVGLIPFRLTEATLKLNPVKTLEYLAAGLPVVATALPDLVRYYSDLIAIADNEDEFINQVRSALESPGAERQAAGIERARGASWEAMTDKTNKALGVTNSIQVNQAAASTDSIAVGGRT